MTPVRTEQIGDATLILGDCRRIEEAYRQPRLFAEPRPQAVQGAML